MNPKTDYFLDLSHLSTLGFPAYVFVLDLSRHFLNLRSLLVVWFAFYYDATGEKLEQCFCVCGVTLAAVVANRSALR